jgi:hypothetical protein
MVLNATLGVVVVAIVWELDFQLPVQSVPINTKVVSSNSAHEEVYWIKHNVIKFVSHLQQVGAVTIIILSFTKKGRILEHDLLSFTPLPNILRFQSKVHVSRYDNFVLC